MLALFFISNRGSACCQQNLSPLVSAELHGLFSKQETSQLLTRWICFWPMKWVLNSLSALRLFSKQESFQLLRILTKVAHRWVCFWSLTATNLLFSQSTNTLDNMVVKLWHSYHEQFYTNMFFQNICSIRQHVLIYSKDIFMARPCRCGSLAASFILLWKCCLHCWVQQKHMAIILYMKLWSKISYVFIPQKM